MRNVLVLLSGLIPLGALSAQEQPPARAGQDRPPVVVTATRIPEEDAVKAGAVTAFTGSELRAAQVDNAAGLGANVPGLQTVTTQRRSSFFGMRGVINGSLGEVPAVGLYLDDIPYTDWRNIDLDLYDIESVTVYRGPQATAFGKMAEAGAISVRSRAPGDKLAGDAGVRGGSYGAFRGAVGLRGPIAEKTASFSLSGLFDRRDGYLDNTAGGGEDDRQNFSGRARVEVLPVEPLSVMVVAEGQRASDGADPYSLLHQHDPYKVAYDVDPHNVYESWHGAARLAYQAPWFEVLSVTSRRTFDTDDALADFDFTAADQVILIEGRAATSLSQEIRLDTKDRFKEWRARLGGYYEGKDTESEVSYQIDDPVIAGLLGIPLPVPVRDRQIGRTWATTLAVYGDATYTLEEQFDFTLGARFESYRVKVHKKHLMESYPIGMAVETAPRVHDERTDDIFLPRAAFSWRPTEDMTAYALFSTGYRPAGYSQISDNPALIGWDPEWIRNYEAGVKSAWFNRALQAKASLYWQDLRNFQVRRLIGMTEVTNVNADEAYSRGIELEVVGRPIESVELGGSLGFIQARFEDFTDPNGVVFDDNHLPQTPGYDYTLYAQVLQDGWFGRVQWDGAGRYWYDEWNVQRQVAYGLLHARVGYESDHWAVFLSGWNLLDQVYHPYAVPGGFMTADYVGYLGTPRTVGIEAVVRF